jgi:hypothetical protein
MPGQGYNAYLDSISDIGQMIEECNSSEDQQIAEIRTSVDEQTIVTQQVMHARVGLTS